MKHITLALIMVVCAGCATIAKQPVRLDPMVISEQERERVLHSNTAAKGAQQ